MFQPHLQRSHHPNHPQTLAPLPPWLPPRKHLPTRPHLSITTAHKQHPTRPSHIITHTMSLATHKHFPPQFKRRTTVLTPTHPWRASTPQPTYRRAPSLSHSSLYCQLLSNNHTRKSINLPLSRNNLAEIEGSVHLSKWESAVDTLQYLHPIRLASRTSDTRTHLCRRMGLENLQ